MYPRGGTIPISFVLVNAIDGSPITTGTVTVSLTKDNGAQAAMTNAAVHKGNGQWTIVPTTTESDADVMHILAQHADAVPVNLMIVTSAKLVSELNDFDPATQTVTLANGSVTAAKIADGAIRATKIADSTITAAKIAMNALDGKGDWNTVTPPSVDAIADQVWDEATAGHIGAGSFGALVEDVLADTNELQSDWADGGRLDSMLDSMAGANFNTSTDSLEAIRDRGDAAWVTGGGGVGGSTNLIIGAVMAVTTPENTVGNSVKLEIFDNEAKGFTFTILDANENPIALDAITKKFIVETADGKAIKQFEVANADMTVSGSNNEIVLVPVSSAQSGALSPGVYQFRLWNTDDNIVLAHGEFEVFSAGANT